MADEATPSSEGDRESHLVLFLLAIIAFGLLFGLGYAALLWFNWKYPYGFGQDPTGNAAWLWRAFEQYASDHDGHFPDGGETPETSLALLYPQYADASCLRSASIPLSRAQQLLMAGRPLNGKDCRWHYIPGLTLSDDPELALAYEKEPSAGGSRLAVLVGSFPLKAIPASQWSAFLAEQQKLLSQRDEEARKARPQMVAKVRLPSGEVVDRYNAPYTRVYEMKALPDLDRQRKEFQEFDQLLSGSRSSSGPALQPSILRWYRSRDSLHDGDYTFKLTLGAMTSKPVRVEIRNGKCSPHEILFEMQDVR